MEMDWFSTIAELTNSKIIERIDGKSLVPIISDNDMESPHDVINWQVGSYDDQNAQWAVRRGPWKLMGNVKEPAGRGDMEELPNLYLVNLDEDISEQNNLAESRPEKLSELLGLHKKWLNAVRKEKAK